MAFVGAGRLQRVDHDLTREGAPLEDVVLLLVSGVVLGVVASTLLGAIYERLPAEWFTGRGSSVRLAGVAVVLACLLGLPVASAWHAIEARMAWQSPEFVAEIRWSYQVGYVFALTFWMYIYHSARVAERFRKAEAQLAALRAQRHQAELAALRSQFDAHFLFNALSSAIGLAAVRPRRAMDLLRDLSALLRRTLEARDQTTHSLHEEVDFLLRYLRVEQVRFGPELHLRLHVDDELSGVDVPRMLLQPLVENAVKHGTWHGGALSIELRAQRHGREVSLEVINSGSLRSATEVADGRGASHHSVSRTSAGLRLVRERLRTCYPRSGRFELQEERENVVARIAFDLRERLPRAA